MFEVRLATEADQAEILALVTEMIPGVDAQARWDWLYTTNPSGRALTWIATRDGQVAGCTSFFPYRLWLDGAMTRGALGGDGYVRPAFRRHGLGGLLHDASRRGMAENNIGCMYGAPGAMNLTPLKHGGSREVGTVSRWVRPLRAPLFRPLRVGRLTPMEPLDSRVDEVWQAARTELRLACVRDAAFYTWRFLAAPAQRQSAFIVEDRKGRAIGACALEAMDDRTMHIVDMFARPGEWHACLRAIARYATDETGAKVLSIKLFTIDGRTRNMWRSGFAEREHKPFLCMIPRDGDRRFVDPSRWFYCGADSDLDVMS